MNDTEPSLSSEASERTDAAKPPAESSSQVKNIGVYDRPERAGGLSPLVMGFVALFVAIVLIIIVFQVL